LGTSTAFHVSGDLIQDHLLVVGAFPAWEVFIIAIPGRHDLLDDFDVSGDGYNLPRDVPDTVLLCSLRIPNKDAFPSSMLGEGLNSLLLRYSNIDSASK
jgi:hypothetical protein